MRLRSKVQLIIFSSLFSVAGASVLLGTLTIDHIVYRLNKELLEIEVNDLTRQVSDAYHVLVVAGVVTAPEYVQRSQAQLIEKFLQRPRHYESEELFVLDKSGDVIYHPNHPPGIHIILPYNDSLYSSDSGFIEHNGANESHFIAYRHFDEWQWVIALSVSHDEIYAQRTIYTWQIVALTLSILIIALWISGRFGTRLARDVEQTGQTIDRVKGGDLNARIAPISSTDEIEGLQLGLNAMIAERQRSELEILKAKQDAENASLKLVNVNSQLAASIKTANRLARDADQASRAKGEFLANMSHEIRTPMNGVLGNLQLIMDSQLTHDQRRYLNAMQQSGEHLVQVVNDILDFSRIESGRLRIQAQPFQLNRLLEATCGLLRFKASQKGLYIKTSISTDVPPVLIADADRLRQILINLIDNGIKFTNQGGVNVCCSIDKANKDTVVLHIEVKDTGIGISQDQQQRIFNAFEQADNSASRTHGGTGLGLSISKRLAELMGGTLTVDGQEKSDGGGSLFHLQIPCTTSKIASNSDLSMPTSLSSTTGSHADAPLPVLNILLAEDNQVNQELAQNILQSMGQRITTAGEGAQAVKRVQEQAFDLVLMDIHMPVMDGIQATKLIRRWEQRAPEQRPTLPIFALSADVMAQQQNKCFQAGMSGFISKPFERSQLEALIRRVGSKIKHPSTDQSALDQPASERVATADSLYPTGHWEADAAQQPELSPANPPDLNPPGINTTVQTASAYQPRNRLGSRQSEANRPTQMSSEIQLKDTPTELLNYCEALQRSMGDLSLLKGLLARFINDLPATQQSVQHFFDSTDADGLEHTCHRLGGSAANLGFDQLAVCCLALKQVADSQQWDTSTELVEQFDDQCRAILRYFSRHPHLLRSR